MKQIIKPLIWLRVGHFGLAAFFGFGATTTALDADLGGVKVALVEPAVAAKVKAELLSPYRLKVEVDRRGELKPLMMRIELPASGPKTWPAADVEVRDAHGNALGTTRTLRYYLGQYHQFDASQNSTGMDDSYGNRFENFRRVLGQHLQRGLWCRIHFHSIGEGLSSSEANFRAALDLVKAYGDALWIAGMADIYKYQAERNTAKLTLIESGARQLKFQFTCQTDPALYDQPLTVEIVRSPAMKVDRFEVKDDQGNRLTSRSGPTDGIALLRFDMPPRGAVYAIELTP